MLSLVFSGDISLLWSKNKQPSKQTNKKTKEEISLRSESKRMMYKHWSVVRQIVSAERKKDEVWKVNTVHLPAIEVSKSAFLLVWIFSIVRVLFFSQILLLSEISKEIHFVFLFVQSKMFCLKVSRKSLVLKHGHGCLF